MKKLLVAIAFICITFCSNAQNNLQQDSSQIRYLEEQKKLGKKFSDDFYPNYVQMHKLSEKTFTKMIDSSANGFTHCLPLGKKISLLLTYLPSNLRLRCILIRYL
ncbi:hypothetical protein [Pedobacter metabolipauper]|uniref:Uncharacterized protein n=1 Tax=Pedobacter metabolipauper TaxID=425513 RepID=A0A4R6SRD4_9SPHI|nr:hypothetical protein [Pedobacter metabolipauper]TDQ06200.1 hypothetical protein ATK78_4581 [Pedobacter metabolipauper]